MRTEGARIVGDAGEPVSLAGMSFFWSQWEGEFYNAGAVSWLKEDWKVSIVRAAVGIEKGGYLENPESELAKIRRVVDAAIAEDLYVIIDWHDHHAEDHRAEAVDFFTEMARDYGEHPHVIYEIYNEPLDVSWSDTIKPYAEAVISAIRKHDPDNLVVVGTPRWSQRVDQAAADPLDDPNVAYTLHFYAGTHGRALRARARKALKSGAALMVTEWGTVNANGDGQVARRSVETWLRFLREQGLSHLNWAVSDKDEGASVLKPGTSPNGPWAASDLTESGQYVRGLVRGWSSGED
ncbi:MAG: glycoside hydrolase family 5 protein [Acidobacteriota bacterium]